MDLPARREAHLESIDGIQEAIVGARAGGEPIDTSVRDPLASVFGFDFSRVRVHTDSTSHALNRSLGATAFTSGHHVFFDRGSYEPTSTAGRQLLAHELVHVLQQTSQGASHAPSASRGVRTALSHPGDTHELEADRVADRAVQRLELGLGAAPRAANGSVGSRSKSFGLDSLLTSISPVTHGAVVQRQPRVGSVRSAIEQARLDGARDDAERVARDYTEAHAYLSDFYAANARIHIGLSAAAHRAINSFTAMSGIPIPNSRMTANVAYQAIRIVLGILPGAASVIAIFEKLSRGLELAISGSRLATIAGTVAQRTAAGINASLTAEPRVGSPLATVAALDTLSQFDTQGAQAIERERALMRSFLTQAGANAASRGRALEEVRSDLGPIPAYDADAMQQFERGYELELDKNYYRTVAWVNHRPPSFIGNPYTSYTIMEVPPQGQARILLLQGQLGRVAHVSIDTRFAGDNQDYAETVKILLDWGIPLYWSRGYVGHEPTPLHTGDDLRMPYRGDRFREVR